MLLVLSALLLGCNPEPRGVPAHEGHIIELKAAQQGQSTALSRVELEQQSQSNQLDLMQSQLARIEQRLGIQGSGSPAGQPAPGDRLLPAPSPFGSAEVSADE